MKKRIFNLIILDESGSMEVIRRQALDGLLETVSSIRSAQLSHPDQEHYLTMVTFNSTRINTILDKVRVTPELTSPVEFIPESCTPLYDAMGTSITHLEKSVAPDDVVLVTVITDGYENASKEYSGRTIKAMVTRLRSKGWVFTYIGANQDVEHVAETMGINNRMAFAQTDEGTVEMFEKLSVCRDRFYSRVDDSACSIDADTKFFEE